MLGAIATLLNFSSEIATKNLARKVVFIITCDEETDMQSIKYILAKKFDSKSGTALPIGAIIMEPTNMHPVIAHRGVVAGKITVKGKFSHVSRPDLMIDPIEPLLDILSYFKLHTAKYLNEEMADEGFIPQQSQMTIYSLKTHEKGRNTPEIAEFGYVFHYLPDNYPSECLEKLDEYVRSKNTDIKNINAQSSITHEIDFKMDSFSTPDTSTFANKVASHTISAKFKKVGFFTEAGHFQNVGIPVTIVGPGSILQAHTPDEFVEVSQLDQSLNFLKNIYKGFLIE